MATNTTVNGKRYYRLVKEVNGSRKQFYGKSRKDAEAKYAEFLKGIDTDACVEPQERDRATFGALMDTYATEVLSVSQKYAHGTIGRYKSVYKTHIRGKPITKKQMLDITASDIQRFYNSLPVSQQTMRAVHKFMSAYFKWAVRSGYAKDVLSAVEIPKKYDNARISEVVVWTDDEIHAILDALDGSDKISPRFRANFMVKVLLFTGMRISEVLCLRYSDIRDGIIHVDRQYYLGEIKEPKWGSKRQIPMHDELVRSLPGHIAWQKEDMMKHEYTTDYLFTTSKGNLYCASAIRKMLVSMCNNIGIPYKHVHSFRSTFCTRMCRCGVPIEITSSLMGHKSIETTAKYYAFINDSDRMNAMEKLTF